MWLLLSLLKCLHLNTWVIWLLSFLFSPWSYRYRSEWVASRAWWIHENILKSFSFKGNWLCPYLLCWSCRRFLQQLFSNSHYLLQNDTCILEFIFWMSMKLSPLATLLLLLIYNMSIHISLWGSSVNEQLYLRGCCLIPKPLSDTQSSQFCLNRPL